MSRIRRFSLLLLAALAASLALWRLMPPAREPLTDCAVPARVLPGATDETPAPVQAAPETTGVRVR